MIKNYLKFFLRNLKNNKIYSLINIIGLSTGMVCFALIMLYVNDELSYDRYHAKAEKIYRVNVQFKSKATDLDMATAGPPWGIVLKRDYPEVMDFTRIRKSNNILIEYQEKKFYESGHIYADSSLFSLFDYRFIKGDPSNSLKRPNTVVLTQSIAEKYFGDLEPIGQVMRFNSDTDCEVTGIIEDIPSNTNLQYNIMSSNTGRQDSEDVSLNGWTDLGNMYTFIELNEGVDYKIFEEKISGMTDEHASALNAYGMSMKTSLQPLLEIHLNSDLSNDFNSTSDRAYVYIFSTIGMFILMIASINYMNLATARSAIRVKEVGMRKVLGAKRIQLIRQFLGESIIFSFFAAILAIALIELLMPFFNSIADKSIDIDYSGNIFLNIAFFLSAVLVGIFSGSYPAFILSSFRPISMLQKKTGGSKRESYLRKGLVVLQFSISIILIVGTIIVSQQLSYFKEKDLGLNPDQILVISMQGVIDQEKYESFKQELLNVSGVMDVTGSNGTPGTNSGFASIFYEKGKTINDQKLFLVNSVDYNYFDLYDIEIISGREFSRDLTSDAGSTIIMNEAAVKEIGWDNIEGKTLVGVAGEQGQSEFDVIGVVKDFHHFSLQQEISPMVMYVIPRIFNFVSAKLNTENISDTIERIEKKWNEFSPNFPMVYTFVDEDFASKYRETERFGRLSRYFAILAIIIACLGLFGLSSFTAEQRTKEIGIRKALGSSIYSIVILMTKEFTKWVLAANVIAWPAAYIVMSSYLDEFAYRINIGVSTFIISSIAAFAIALFTVSFQAMKAASANPVNSLRSE